MFKQKHSVSNIITGVCEYANTAERCDLFAKVYPSERATNRSRAGLLNMSPFPWLLPRTIFFGARGGGGFKHFELYLDTSFMFLTNEEKWGLKEPI